MKSTLAAIQFFANSANSVRVFEALADGPTSSSDLADRAGASRSTVARILDEGESRGWIDSAGSRYRTTAIGEVMIEEFRGHMDAVEAVQHLGEALEWLPPAARSIDVRDLGDAVVTRSTPDNPAAPFDRGLELIRTADEYLGLNSTAIPRYTRVIRDRLLGGSMDAGGVIQASFVESLHDDPDRAGPWRDFAEVGATRVYDGRVPIDMHVVDDEVLIWLGERSGDGLEVYGLLESGNPSVVSWAESLYERYRTEAEPLDRVSLPDA